jgi:hypothetical protein
MIKNVAELRFPCRGEKVKIEVWDEASSPLDLRSGARKG